MGSRILVSALYTSIAPSALLASTRLECSVRIRLSIYCCCRSPFSPYPSCACKRRLAFLALSSSFCRRPASDWQRLVCTPFCKAERTPGQILELSTTATVSSISRRTSHIASQVVFRELGCPLGTEDYQCHHSVVMSQFAHVNLFRSGLRRLSSAPSTSRCPCSRL